MSDDRKAYLLICVNTDKLPVQIPLWAMQMVDVMSAVRIAIIELEQSASTIANCTDDERDKAERCARLFGRFDEQHGNRVKELAALFTLKRSEVDPEIAQSFGMDLVTLALMCSNIAFRGGVFRKVLEQSMTWKLGESIAFFALSESSKGQSALLDWGAQFVIAPKTDCTA